RLGARRRRVARHRIHAVSYRRSGAVNRLAIFDIDGTLTDTNGVDDDCYRIAIAEALGVAPSAIDWSGAAHVTDSEIFRWLCAVHRRTEPSADELARAFSIGDASIEW